jgi:hypothetical protein
MSNSAVAPLNRCLLRLIFSSVELAYRDRPAPCNATGSRSAYAILGRAGKNRSVGAARGTRGAGGARGTRGVGAALAAAVKAEAAAVKAAENTQN